MALHQVHALSAASLSILRTRIPEQHTDIRLAIWPKIPDAVVWEARVDGVPASNDMVYEVDFDGGGANFADTIADMTVWIGSSARSYDRGIARLRSAAPGVAGTLDIGETSEIDWTDDDYITVLDEFGLWPRHVYLNPAGVIFMDRDIAYTDQHEYPDPIPILLSDEVVEYDGVLGGANTVDVYFDASDSWALDAGALTYSWVAPGASATAGMATATPTVTYNAAGTFRVACTVSRDYGGGHIKTFTAYRYVHIFDNDNPPVTSFYLDSCSGDWSSGGWSFSVTMEDNATRSEVVDRAKVILFAKDNTTSIGPIYSDTHGILRANIIAIGWIAGETIHYNNEKGTVEFDVQGPQFWFDKMPAFPHGLEDYDGSPTNWLEFEDLDVRSGDWSWLRWRTTAPRCMDFYVPIADARQIAEYSEPGSSSLWDQIKRINEQTILASPACNRYGQLWVQRPLSLLFDAERVGTPTVMGITKTDWRDQIDLTRTVVNEMAMLDASGVGYLNAVADPYYMLALGHIYGRYGGVDSMEKLALFTNQATNNIIAGLLWSYANNKFPNIDIRMAGYYRVMDIVPHQRLTMSIAEADTERGIVWTDKTIVPISVMITHDGGSGVLEVDLSCEAETFAKEGITGDPPPTIPSPPTTPPSPPSPPVEPPPPPSNYGAAVMNEDQMAITFNPLDASPDWYNFDPNGDLVGAFQNMVVGSNLEAYCTTRDDLDMTNTGVWYCSDITAVVGWVAGVIWTLIIPADGPSPSAVADTGYNNTTHEPCFGPLFINVNNVAYAAVKSSGNFAPPGGPSGGYRITGGVPSYANWPVIGASPVYTHADRSLFNVWGWSGNFFIGCMSQAAGFGSLVYEETAVLYVFDKDPPESQNPVGINNGYVRTWNTIAVPPNSNIFGDGAWTAATSQSIVTENGGFAITTDWMGLNILEFLYQDTAGAYDLYHNIAGQIGIAANEFAVGAEGGLAAFIPLDTDQIFWVCANNMPFATTNIVVYTDDQGASWISKDGGGATSLQNALGAPVSWTGYTNVNIANSIIRVFEY